MEERFAEFRAEIWLGQEDAAAKALKRARYEKLYEYNRKSNQEQAAFNAKVDEAVAEAELQDHRQPRPWSELRRREIIR